MLIKRAGRSKHRATQAAGVSHGRGTVPQCVRAQGPRGAKRLAAGGARVGTLAGVLALVVHEETRLLRKEEMKRNYLER